MLKAELEQEVKRLKRLLVEQDKIMCEQQSKLEAGGSRPNPDNLKVVEIQVEGKEPITGSAFVVFELEGELFTIHKGE